jgi:hypothetical protein
MKLKILLILFFFQGLLGETDKKNLVPKKSSIPLELEIEEAFNPYQIDKSDDIEDKLKTWTLRQIEDYATKNNPLYLAEKKNIGIARGDVITASLYRNPVISYQNQFIPLGGGNSTNYLPAISSYRWNNLRRTT